MDLQYDYELSEMFAPMRELPQPSQELTRRIMAEIGMGSQHPLRVVHRPVTHRTQRWKMLGIGASLAFVFLVTFLVNDRPGPDNSFPSKVIATELLAPGVVRFVLEAPEARQVSVAGSFNEWRANVTPLHRLSPEGPWIAEVPLATGRYSYMFVVDGHRWVADPAAPIDPIAEFGQSNSIITVVGQGTL